MLKQKLLLKNGLKEKIMPKLQEVASAKVIEVLAQKTNQNWQKKSSALNNILLKNHSGSLVVTVGLMILVTVVLIMFLLQVKI